MVKKNRFNYHSYEMQVRNLEIIKNHLQGFVPYFKNCRHVIDVGCGSGLFLKLLQEANIQATGIENNPGIIEELQVQGFNVIPGNADSVWSEVRCEFDGLICSHLIEHLEFEQVVDLIEGISEKIKYEGIVVFAFPNPESLEMQLLQFWADPQHVRFYQPRLIQAVLRHYGFEIIEAFDHSQWQSRNGTKTNKKGQQTNLLRSIPVLRRLGRGLKEILGIRAIEIEADYVRKLREVGREAVIVARKIGN